MRCAKCIHDPMTILPMSNQGANANDRVVDVLGKFVAHRGANFVIALAFMTIGSGEALECRGRFLCPKR